MSSHISCNEVREKRKIKSVLNFYNLCSLNRFTWYRQHMRLHNMIYRKNYEYSSNNCIIGKYSRNYICTRNNIYIKNKIYDIIPYLCKGKDVKNITSNIIYYILQHLSTKNVVNSNEYKDNIKKIYFNLLKCYHKIFENNNEYGEYIFTLFNDDIIISVSPSLKKKQKNIIQDILLNSLNFFFKNNITYKNKLNINLMCHIISYPKFLYVLHSINYDMNIIKRNISVQNVDYLFSQYINTTNIYITTAIEFASFFKTANMNIFTPFKEHGKFNYFLLLEHIVNKQLKNTLFLLLKDIEYSQLKQEMLLYLVSSDDITGLCLNEWGYLAAKEYLLMNKYGNDNNKIINDDDIKVNILKRSNDNVKDYNDDNHLNMEYFNLPEHLKNVKYIKCLDEFNNMVISIKEELNDHWKNNIYNKTKIVNYTNDDYNDNILTYEYINETLRKEKKRYYMGIDIEWDRYKKKKVSILSISTNNKIYIIDLYFIDYNYKLIIFKFFKWLLENPFIYKLFFNFSSDINIMSSYFQNISHINIYNNIIDLNDNIYIYSKKEEATPSYKNDNILYFEKLNRDMIQSNDIHLFKEFVHSSPYHFNKNIINKINSHNHINILNKQMFKLYFKSLNDLCMKILNKKLNKKLQLANWNIRPLNEEQIIYACIDSYVLIKIEEMLIEKGYMSTCDSNNNQMMNLFVQKYKLRDSTWE
ncbi:exonuclease, putative [Plasmodium sp. gorilla clade G3]|nr:exonuclease, putative [Plasmodium sp. gorilla clade G3]